MECSVTVNLLVVFTDMKIHFTVKRNPEKNPAAGTVK